MMICQRYPTVYTGDCLSFDFVLADGAEFFVEFQETFSMQILHRYSGLSNIISTPKLLTGEQGNLSIG